MVFKVLPTMFNAVSDSEYLIKSELGPLFSWLVRSRSAPTMNLYTLVQLFLGVFAIIEVIYDYWPASRISYSVDVKTPEILSEIPIRNEYFQLAPPKVLVGVPEVRNLK